MKILHTSDWHQGSRLHNWDGTEEELHFFAQLAATVEKEQPDALVVSGDIFDTGAPGNDVAKRFTDALLDVTARCPDMTTVVIAGNHDSYSRLVVDKELWRRARVHVFGMPAEDADGKAVFEKNVVILPGKGVIAAVPFCHPRNFPTVDGAAGDNREKNYFEGLAKYVADHSAGLPTVLMAHLAVKGDLDFRGHDKFLVIGGEECVDVESLGEGYGYVALGHIHCPQWVKGGTQVFEPLHALATIGGKDGLPFEDALKALAESPLPPGTYIRLNVRLGVGELSGADWTERARKDCAAKGFRFCLINPVRTEAPERQESKMTLTMAELKELSNDEVLRILSTRHELTDRQCALVKSLMEEVRS